MRVERLASDVAPRKWTIMAMLQHMRQMLFLVGNLVTGYATGKFTKFTCTLESFGGLMKCLWQFQITLNYSNCSIWCSDHLQLYSCRYGCGTHNYASRTECYKCKTPRDYGEDIFLACCAGWLSVYLIALLIFLFVCFILSTRPVMRKWGKEENSILFPVVHIQELLFFFSSYHSLCSLNPIILSNFH